MKSYSYAQAEINKEYRRAGAGVGLSLLPLLLLGPSSVIVLLLGSFLGLFSAYGIRAYGRSRAEIVVTDLAIQIRGLTEKTIQWEELETLKLAYFSTRSDGEKGWMQLKLKGGGVRLRVESTVTGFWELVDICALEARHAGIALDAVSVRNMQALGLDTDRLLYPSDHLSEKSS